MRNLPRIGQGFSPQERQDVGTSETLTEMPEIPDGMSLIAEFIVPESTSDLNTYYVVEDERDLKGLNGSRHGTVNYFYCTTASIEPIVADIPKRQC